jgi:hypothetical protein
VILEPLEHLRDVPDAAGSIVDLGVETTEAGRPEGLLYDTNFHGRA